jgi:hypothetical protein
MLLAVACVSHVRSGRAFSPATDGKHGDGIDHDPDSYQSNFLVRNMASATAAKVAIEPIKSA